MSKSEIGGPALFAIVRYWSRRWMGPWQDTSGGDAKVQSIQVLEAIASTPDDQSCSIGDVARRIGIDHSVASRMVSRAVHQGLIRKHRSTLDPRQAELEILSAGDALLNDAHRWQASVFTDLTREWPSDDADRFAEYLARVYAQLEG